MSLSTICPLLRSLHLVLIVALLGSIVPTAQPIHAAQPGASTMPAPHRQTATLTITVVGDDVQLTWVDILRFNPTRCIGAAYNSLRQTNPRAWQYYR